MRIATMSAATAIVIAGFAGSMTAAHALSIPNPLDSNAPLELPMLAPDAATDLTVTYRADGEAEPVVMDLTCEPTGGDHPRAEQACASLAEAEAAGSDPFAAPSGQMACTQIYGGPQTAAVVGTWNGRAVDAEFSRTDGCEIARWDAIEPVLSPTPPQVSGGG